MASNKLELTITGDARGALRALGDVEGKSRGIGRTIGRAAGIAAAGFAALGAGAVIAGRQILDQGTTLEVLRVKTKTVFEGATKDVQRWADRNNEAFGMTDEQLAGTAAAFGDLLKPMGFTAREAAGMSKDVVGLSGALAAWSGGQHDAAEVSQILSKAMLGEREELKSLGISITEADVQARLAQKGQEGLTGAALQQAKAMATQELLFEKSTDAQRAWNDGSMDAIKDQNELKATVGELQEELVSALFPAFQKGAKWLKDEVVPALREFGEWLGPRLKEFVADAGPVVKDVIGTVRDVMAEVVDWVRANWPEIRETVASVMETVAAVIGAVVETVQVLWDNFGDNIMTAINRTWPRIQQIITGVMDVIQGVVKTVTSIIKGDWGEAWDGIKQTFRGVWEAMQGIVFAALERIRFVISIAWEVIKGITTGAWDAIKAPILLTWNAIKSAVGDAVRLVRRRVTEAWMGIKETTSRVWNAIKWVIAGAMEGIKTAIRTARDAVETIWGGIKRAFRVPVKLVLDVVVNPFLGFIEDIADFVGLGGRIPGPFNLDKFHSGGEIGGPRGRERPFMGLGGEGVANLGAMSMLTPAGLAALNRGDRSAAMEHLSGTGGDGIGDGWGFPSPGGIVSGITDKLKGAGSAVGGFGSAALERLRDMPAAIGRVASKLRDLLGGLGEGGFVRRLHAGAMRAPIRHILDKLPDLRVLARGVGPNLQQGAGWKAQWDAVKGEFPDAQLFSAFRPGSITSSGNLSYHAMDGGRAIDISPRMDIFDWIHRLYGPKTKELIFTPAGGRQIHNGGKHVYSGSVAAQHWDHIHWAMRNGGLVKGGRGGVSARIGDGRQDELVTPLPAGFSAASMAIDYDKLGKAVARHMPTTFRFDGADRLVVEGGERARRRGLAGAPPRA